MSGDQHSVVWAAHLVEVDQSTDGQERRLLARGMGENVAWLATPRWGLNADAVVRDARVASDNRRQHKYAALVWITAEEEVQRARSEKRASEQEQGTEARRLLGPDSACPLPLAHLPQAP